MPANAVVLLLTFLVPSSLLIYIPYYQFCKRKDPARGTREAVFGTRERILGTFTAVKVFVAFGIIVAGVYGSQTAIPWLINNVTGPAAESSIEQVVSDLPVLDTQQETGKEQLQFLEAERDRAVSRPLRSEAARVVLGEAPAVSETLTVSFFSLSNRRLFRESITFLTVGGITVIAGLLFMSLVLYPILYWKLERDTWLFKKKLVRRH